MASPTVGRGEPRCRARFAAISFREPDIGRTVTRRATASQPSTVREQIALSYANLARAHAALERGARKYARMDHIVRSKLRRRLIDGTMRMRSLYDDERIKMTAPQACYYCGSRHRLCADHLIPKMRGGPDASDNLVWACRGCNSSKAVGTCLSGWRSRTAFPTPVAAPVHQDRGPILRGARIPRFEVGSARRRARDAV